MKSVLCRIAAAAGLFLLCALAALAQVPLGYVQVTGALTTDSSGAKVANGTIAFAPVNNTGQAIGYQVNGAGHAITSPVTTLVTNGAFSIQLADTSQTSPVNVCFSVTVTDNTSGKSYLGPGYTCFQPAGYGTAVSSGMCTAATGSVGGTCNFDKFVPNLPGLVVQQPGIAGPVGPPGPAGPPGGSSSFPGVVSDSANGLAVTGKVGAKALQLGPSPLAADDTCSAGVYWIAPVLGAVNSWRECNNGVLTGVGGNLGTIAQKNALGAGAFAATIDAATTGSLAVYGSDGRIISGGASPAAIAVPTAGLIAQYDFHEGSGTAVHDVAPGATGSNDWTLTSGTPASTVAPKWIPAANGGGGLAIGSDPGLIYGLTASGGTSCETLPINANQSRSIVMQVTYPPTVANSQYLASWAMQTLLGSGTVNAGYFVGLYASGPLIRNNNGTNVIWTNDIVTGTHVWTYVLPASGLARMYIDGIESTSYLGGGVSNISLPTASWVIGCNNGTVQNGIGTSNVSAPNYAIYLHNLLFYSSELTPAQVGQATGALQTNFNSTKALNYNLQPIEAQKNEIMCSGDSTTQGSLDAVGTPSPYCTCLTTSNCYSGGYATSIPNFNNIAWVTRAYGLPGIGLQTIYYQQYQREGATRGRSNYLHVNIIWIGINGLSATEPIPCGIIKNASALGFDAWVMTLYSLSNVAATDQGGRDAYNYSILQEAKACGATGIINLADDAFIGKDGVNGGLPYWTSGGGGVHMAAKGYAYVASIVNRVLQAHYWSTPDVWKTISTSGASTLNIYDRYVIADNTAGAQTLTMPDCIGATGMRYRFRVKGTNATTVQAATVSGQTEQVEGGASTVLNTGMYTFQVMSNATISSAPGGCNYVMVN